MCANERNRPTVKDIANALNLSVSTVSRALNKKGKLKPNTIKSIEYKAKEMGYLPNYIARSLKSNITYTVGAIIPDITNPIFPKYARGILDSAVKKGYQVYMLNSDMNIEKEKAALESLLSKRVDGLILTSTNLSDKELSALRDKDIPFVVTRREIKVPGVSYVDVNNFYGGYIAGNYLIKQGRKKIAFIGSRFSGEPAQKRLKGFIKAIEKYNMEVDKRLIIEEETSIEGGYVAAKEAYEKGADSIFAYNDIMAIGALTFASEQNLRLPEDFSIIGFDDIYLSSLPFIKLTTIRQPMYYIGSKAFSVLLHLMTSKNFKAYKVWIKPELVIRKTA